MEPGTLSLIIRQKVDRFGKIYELANEFGLSGEMIRPSQPPVFPRLAATSVSLTLQIEPYNSALLSEPSPNIKAETGPEIVTRTPLDYLELSETDKLSVTFQIKAGDDEILRRFF